MTMQDDENSRRGALATIRIGVLVLAVTAAGFVFWALRSIFEPLALAVFLLLVIDGLARAIADRIPPLKRAAMPLAICLIVAMFGFSIWLIAHNGRAFAADAPQFKAGLDNLLATLSTRFGLETPPSLSDMMGEFNPASWLGAVAKGAQELVERFVFVLVYLGFLLASSQGFGKKLAAMLESDRGQQEAARVLDRVRRGVESYVFVQTVVGVVIAVLSVLIMEAMGVNHAFFFGFLIFLSNYVPAIGAAVGVLVPPLFALLQFGEPVMPLVLLAGLEAVHFGVSHVLQPRLQGKQLNLDPIFVLLGLTFWGYLWGLTGAFLSTPLTVTLMAILAEQKGARWAAVLLSSDGKPYADEEAAAESLPPDPQKARVSKRAPRRAAKTS